MSDSQYLQAALAVARKWSDDPRTQTGAILHVPGIETFEAANSVPGRVAITSGVLEPPLKYAYIEHAERAVIYKAAKFCLGYEDWEDATLYAPWFACADCARAIVSVGVGSVVGLASLRDMTPARWRRSVEAGERILISAGIPVRWVCGSIGAKVLFDGREIYL